MRKNHKATARFDRFSVAVWTIWLIPCFCGMLTGIPTIDLSANAAFGAALIGAGAIGLILYLRGDARGQRIDAIDTFVPFFVAAQST